MSGWQWKEVCPGARGWNIAAEKDEVLGEGEGCKPGKQRMGILEEEPRDKLEFEWLLRLLVLKGPFMPREDALVLLP